jgi:uncharacterized RDD family membrane protein YckC
MRYSYIRKRIYASVIDYTLVNLLTVLFIVYCGEKDVDGNYYIHGFACFVPLTLWFVYFVVAETFGGTLGHRTFKLKVVSMDGRDLRFRQILRRRLCDVFDICLSFGWVALLLIKNSKYRQRLGDRVARTVVIGESDIFNRLETTTRPHPE